MDLQRLPAKEDGRGRQGSERGLGGLQWSFGSEVDTFWVSSLLLPTQPRIASPWAWSPEGPGFSRVPPVPETDRSTELR